MTRMSIDGFAGELLRPGDAAYAAHRAVWNAIVDRRPALIARCTSAADVAAAIRFARACDLEIAVKCGGHGILGLAVPEGGIQLDLTPMGSVRVDPDQRRAYVGGGALLGTMDRAMEPHGMATTAGEISHTGVGGLTLGGGFGWLARQFGMSCDNVESYTLVTAAGDIVRASATEHPDLYWGLRGGGGNFGVVTEFVFRLHPIPGTALMADLTFDVADGIRPIERWRDLLADAPRAATLNSGVGTDANGRSVVTLGYTWVGDLAEANAYLPILRSIGTPLEEEVRTLRYIELQTLFDDQHGHGTRRYSKGHYLAELTDPAIQAYLTRGVGTAAAETDSTQIPRGGLELHGGAVADVADEDSAYSGRGALLEWSGSTAWTDPAEDQARLAAARAYGTAMESFASGVYVNMLGDEGEAGVRRAYRSDKLTRLTALKRIWDPDNVFHLNQNIKPG
jgi:FAD/FMN-containing dehydrogenase